MASFGEFRPILGEIAKYLRMIAFRPCVDIVTTGGVNTSIPAGFRSISIIKTSANTDTTTVTLSDGTTYLITEKGEGFEDAGNENGTRLPLYTISGGSWKWHGIK